MTLRELECLLFQARQHHADDELVCIYNQETGERIDIEYVDDTIDSEIQLNIRGGLTDDS